MIDYFNPESRYESYINYKNFFERKTSFRIQCFILFLKKIRKLIYVWFMNKLVKNFSLRNISIAELILKKLKDLCGISYRQKNRESRKKVYLQNSS